MIKKIPIFLLVIFSGLLSAQTGIGTITPNSSAKLEVYATNKGFLPPRISLTGATDVSTIASPATGLLIYNTAIAGTSPNNVMPGYYYWNGASWVQISNGLIIDSSKTTSFTLSSSDNNKLFLISSSSNVTVTVPSSLSAGFSCQIIQTGAGMITIAGSSVTLYSSNGFNTRTTNSAVGLVLSTATTGYIYGDTIY